MIQYTKEEVIKLVLEVFKKQSLKKSDFWINYKKYNLPSMNVINRLFGNLDNLAKECNIIFAVRNRAKYLREHPEVLEKILKNNKIFHRGLNFEDRFGVEKANLLKDNLRKIHLGKIPHNKGRTVFESYDLKTANKILKINRQNGKIHKGRKKPEGFGEQIRQRQLGKTYEQRLGINMAAIAKNKIKKIRAGRIFPLKDSLIEVKIQNFLKELNINFYTHQYIKEIEHGYQCDIFIPKYNLIIECDGVYWHNYPDGREIDKIRTNEMLEMGFKVLRLWENEIKKMNLDNFKLLLDKYENVEKIPKVI